MKYFGIGIILLAFVLFLTGCRVNKQLFKGNGLLKSEELNNFNTYNAYELEVNYINLSTESIKIKFIELAEAEPVKLPLAGTIDWKDGKRHGLAELALTKFSYAPTVSFAKIREVESKKDINAK